MKKKKEEKNPIIGYKGENVNLVSFFEKNEKDQYKEVEKILTNIYGENLKLTKKHMMKVIRLTWNPKDDYIYLPYGLKVTKEKFNLKFHVVKKKISSAWIVFFTGLFIFALLFATYTGIKYISLMNLNKDIDNDGIADINIDLDNNGLADLNIDLNDDNKPDINIDYRHNLKSVFNIDTDNDGMADSNMVINASDKEKACRINCDTDNDGWPEINIDLDGDGIPETNLDTDNDRIPDLNIDITGDGMCDIMCDDDNDNKCDRNCIEPTEDIMDENGNIIKDSEGDAGTSTVIPTLMIRYINGEDVLVDGLMPDDQPGFELQQLPMKTFTIENLSTVTLQYSLIFVVEQNQFISNNFQYKIESTNGSVSLGYKTVPKETTYIAENISIAPRTSQKYTMTFKLHGTGAPQNEDQGRTFKAYIEVEI